MQFFSNLVAFVALIFFSGVCFHADAQVVSSTTSTVTVSVLVDNAWSTFQTFKNIGVLAGVSALINLLVNVTKFEPVNSWIKTLRLKWIRPLLAFAAGIMAGVVSAVAEGVGGWTLVFHIIGGAMTGGGAIALHELVSAFRGERK